MYIQYIIKRKSPQKSPRYAHLLLAAAEFLHDKGAELSVIISCISVGVANHL